MPTATAYTDTGQGGAGSIYQIQDAVGSTQQSGERGSRTAADTCTVTQTAHTYIETYSNLWRGEKKMNDASCCGLMCLFMRIDNRYRLQIRGQINMCARSNQQNRTYSMMHSLFVLPASRIPRLGVIAYQRSHLARYLGSPSSVLTISLYSSRRRAAGCHLKAIATRARGRVATPHNVTRLSAANSRSALLAWLPCCDTFPDSLQCVACMCRVSRRVNSKEAV